MVILLTLMEQDGHHTCRPLVSLNASRVTVRYASPITLFVSILHDDGVPVDLADFRAKTRALDTLNTRAVILTAHAL